MYNQITSNKRKSVLLLIASLGVLAALGYVFGIITGYGSQITIPVIIFAIVLNLGSYFAGDKIALAVSGAKPLKKEESPYVYNMVENLCITAGLPMPAIYIIQDGALNAFATGRDPKHASIALTTGIVNALQNEELEGVIAHELSHIKNYDIRFMTLVVASVGAIVLLSEFFFRGMLFGGNRDNDRREGNGIIMIVGVVLALLAPIIGELIKLAVSRKREYLADASGALLTRYPDGLANALEKIASSTDPLDHVTDATAHLFISNPFKGKTKHFNGLFSTHPPIEDRIKALRGMTR